ncbi:hypothetical protein L7F22_032337 [Adiantum nelumboides]|nr:hypothetical protein [Adiantum nelumboides]
MKHAMVVQQVWNSSRKHEATLIIAEKQVDKVVAANLPCEDDEEIDWGFDDPMVEIDEESQDDEATFFDVKKQKNPIVEVKVKVACNNIMVAMVIKAGCKVMPCAMKVCNGQVMYMMAYVLRGNTMGSFFKWVNTTKARYTSLYNMRIVQGCLLPVLQRYLEPEEEQIQLLLPKSCKARTFDQLQDVKPPSPTEQQSKRKRWRRGNFLFPRTLYINAEKLQERAKPASPDMCGGATSIFRACSCLISRACKMMRACAEGSHESSESGSPNNRKGSREPDEAQIHENGANHPPSVDEQVCIYLSRSREWTTFNPKLNIWRILPHANVDPMFEFSDKECLIGGTHMLWIGKVLSEFACYKYDLLSNSWELGPSMVTPRCHFGSATCGQYAYVAGGFSVDGLETNVLNSAERYDSIKGTWEPLPPMNTPRHDCSGVFMDGKFYVIGGKSRNYEQLTCGEEYDPVKNTWRVISNMHPAPLSVSSFELLPLHVAVVGNELYAVENSRNLLKVYEMGTNRWRALGLLPVRADIDNGWGMAFKGLGDQLLVMGGYNHLSETVSGSIFLWRPQPGALAPEWQLINSGFSESGSFLYNCAVFSC